LVFIKRKNCLRLWVFMLTFALPLLGWPLLALASYDQYMPQQEELPGGFQLKGFHEDNHKWYGDTALQGEWELSGTVYQFNFNEDTTNFNQLQMVGYLGQKDLDSTIIIHVAIGEKTTTFTSNLENLANGGVGEPPKDIALMGRGRL